MKTIGPDKILHFLGCFILAVIGTAIVGPAFGWCGSMAVGAIWEGSQYATKSGVASAADLAADAAGATAGTILTYIIVVVLL